MDEIEKLVTEMHDGLCRCGGRCAGWYSDLDDFERYVLKLWGSSIRFGHYLIEIRRTAWDEGSQAEYESYNSEGPRNPYE